MTYSYMPNLGVSITFGVRTLSLSRPYPTSLVKLRMGAPQGLARTHRCAGHDHGQRGFFSQEGSQDGLGNGST